MRRSKPERMETIEIGAVHLPFRKKTANDEFESFIRPAHHPVLSAFCMALTGIRQEEVDAAEDFPAVFQQFLGWIGTEPYQLCSWGLFDLLQLQADCKRHRLAFPERFANHINLKQEFARLNGVRPCGVKRAFSLAGLTLRGRSHRALADARNIATLAMRAILPKLQAGMRGPERKRHGRARRSKRRL